MKEKFINAHLFTGIPPSETSKLLFLDTNPISITNRTIGEGEINSISDDFVKNALKALQSSKQFKFDGISKIYGMVADNGNVKIFAHCYWYLNRNMNSNKESDYNDIKTKLFSLNAKYNFKQIC